MTIKIEMSEEEIQLDSARAVKVHSFSGLEDVSEFINKVNDALNQSKV